MSLNTCTPEWYDDTNTAKVITNRDEFDEVYELSYYPNIRKAEKDTEIEIKTYYEATKTYVNTDIQRLRFNRRIKGAQLCEM